ncbi:MAG TPA: hypothetical protein DEB39_08625 [Planctomycetaceae bacterium]|nr:hypothetical protein [Planctomycetaceae bacterium]
MVVSVDLPHFYRRARQNRRKRKTRLFAVREYYTENKCNFPKPTIRKPALEKQHRPEGKRRVNGG